MIQKLWIVMFALLFVLSACGSKEKVAGSNEVQQINTSTNEVSGTSNLKTEPKKNEPQKEDPPAPENVNPDEQVVMDFIEVCLNGKDVDQKKKFINEKVDPEVISVFQLAYLNNVESSLGKAKITSSTDMMLNDGSKGKLFLVKGNSEVIVLIRKGKIGWVYENGKEGFEEIKKQF